MKRGKNGGSRWPVCGYFVSAIIIVLSLGAGAIGPPRALGTDRVFDVEGVMRLIDVLDAIMARHPDHEAVSANLESLSQAERTAILETKRRENAEDPEINRRIDALFETAAYKLYYMKFKNMTAEKHREIFYALPYEAIPAPAGIADVLQELCYHRDAVREWTATVVATIDPERCRRVALGWLPDGDYKIPNTYFIYDGNGDAFALWGSVVFDLFGLVMLHRPAATRFDDLEGTGKDEIERVLSHEYHHVFSDPYVYPSGRSYSSWQQRQKDNIVRSIVSEGIAMQCGGRRELPRAVMEDTATVAFWINELETAFRALDDGTMSEQAFQKWYADSYHETAVKRLRDYLVRIYGKDEADARLDQDLASRPSLVYTLGWWMIGRIAATPQGKEVIIRLLSDPHGVFEQYNASLPTGQEALQINVSLP